MVHHRRIGGTIGSIAALLFAAGPVAGCGVDADSPVSIPPIGDVTTLDPCGFIAPDTFADLKTIGHNTEPELVIQPADYIRCNHRLPLAGKVVEHITVSTILRAHTADLAASDAVSTDRGPIHITKGTSENGTSCDATVRLTGGEGVLLYAAAIGNGERLNGVDPCPVRDRAVDAIVATMNSGAYSRIPYPSDSLHGYDLCGSVSLQEVETTVNLTGLTDKSTPAEQDCRWRADDGSSNPPGVTVSLMIKDPSLFLAEGEHATIDGFPAQVSHVDDTGGPERCVITTTTKRWDPWPGRRLSNDTRPLSEQLYTEVILPVQAVPSQACRAATSITTQVLSHRPPK